MDEDLHDHPINGLHDTSHVLEPVAVIGFSLRFPQDATSPEAFWQMLVNGTSALTDVPKDRFNHESFYHADPNKVGTMNVRKAHFLKDDIATFDAPFFSIPPAEAACMDPQQRLLLETAYRALENAGIPTESVVGSKTSVHVGSFTNDYKLILQKDTQMPAKYFATGTEAGMLANRLSWFFDFRGPSMQIDTACSSSLNALHLACQGLYNHDADMGLIGGCNLVFNPESMIAMTDINLLSPDGISYSFDSRANGYSRGEGFGVIIVKLLSKALQDGDTIRAIVRATGSNQDGRTPVITQPSVEAQKALIQDTYATARLNFDDTRYFEAHGTGTPVGDPIEASAINAVFGEYRSQKDPLFVGALKSNIGHLEGASGVAGLIKTILVLEKGIIPKNIWFDYVNPQIPLDKWNIQFPTNTIPWPVTGLRRASVNSFGFGGANAHVILEDAHHYLSLRGISGKHCTTIIPPVPINSASIPSINSHWESTVVSNNSSITAATNGVGSSSEKFEPLLLVLSASDGDGVDRFASAYADYLVTRPSFTIDDRFLLNLAFTLAKKRSQLSWKSFVVASSSSELPAQLANRISRPVRRLETLKLGFVFTGQGAQWWAMGRELFKYSLFAESVSAADQYLQELGCTWSLTSELLKDKVTSNLDDPAFSQPVCTALQIAIVQLLRSWNIKPIAVVGHSSGEIAAAYSIGSISRESAWKIAYYRGVVITQLRCLRTEAEAMMSVGLSETDIQPFLKDVLNGSDKHAVSVACINSPRNVTVSGKLSQIANLREKLLQKGVFARKLNVDSAYHSRAMDAAASQYAILLNDLQVDSMNPISATFFSSLTGGELRTDELVTANYWIRNLTQPVQFSNAIMSMCAPISSGDGGKRYVQNGTNLVDQILEIGPHAALKTPVKENLDAISRGKVAGYSSILIKGMSALETCLQVAGNLHCLGYPVSVAEINHPKGFAGLQMLTDGPEYPFNHSHRYWTESRLSRNFRYREHPEHELLGIMVPDWNPLDARWRKIIRLRENGWIADHKVNGTILFPGAGMVIMAIEAARFLTVPEKEILGYRVQEIRFSKALMLPPEDTGVEVEISLRPIHDFATKSSTWREFQLYANENDEWFECCRGVVILEYRDDRPNEVNKQGEEDHRHATLHEQIAARCKRSIAAPYMYRGFKSTGLEYGKSFQVLNEVAVDRRAREAVGKIYPCNWGTGVSKDAVRSPIVHPTALDGIFQLMLVALAQGEQPATSTMLPTWLDNMWIAANGVTNDDADGGAVQVHVTAAPEGIRSVRSSATALDSRTTNTVIIVTGLRATSIESHGSSSADKARKTLYYNIDWKPDIHLLDRKGVDDYCDASILSLESAGSVEILDLGARFFIATALSKERQEIQVDSKPHLLKYLKWMKGIAESDYAGSSNVGKCDWPDILNSLEAQKDLIRRVEESHLPGGRLIMRIGQNLRDILNGHVDALELLFNDDLMEKFYSKFLENRASLKLASYLDTLTHKTPDLNILEVGAGTGSMTKVILSAIAQREGNNIGTARFGRYTFTDISTGFFEKARMIFTGDEHRVTFQRLDIEEDPFKQGFKPGIYDIVVAANVLHATQSIGVSLQNIRRLLKPGGKLVLFELTVPQSIRTTFIFGILPGWWSGTEEYRKESPLLTPNKWSTLLCDNGFSGTDFHWPDRIDDGQRDSSVIISTSLNQEETSRDMPAKTVIVVPNAEALHDVAQDLRSSLAKIGFLGSEVITLQSLHSDTQIGGHVIFLLELEHSVMLHMTEDLFLSLQNILRSCHVVLWVTKRNGKVYEDPRSSMITGLARTIKSEGYGVRFVALAIEEVQLNHHTANLIAKTYIATITAQPSTYEPELEERNGILYIDRIVEATDISEHVSRLTVPQVSQSQMLGEKSTCKLALGIGSPGLLDTLVFADDDSQDKEIGHDEIQVEIKASGLIFRDVLIAMGLYNDARFGLEFAGTVIDAGSEARMNIGDRVCGWSHGSFKTHTRCKAVTATRIPNNMSFTTAVSFPVAYCTAYYSLIHLAQLKRGESVLIHSAAGGTGQAAIQLANYIGAEIYATVGNSEKKQLLISNYGIAEDHIFSSRTTSFKTNIERTAAGRSVDVVLNSLTDEAFIASLECIAPFGRFIDIGRKDRGALPVSALSKNVMFAVADLSHMLLYRPALLGDLMKSVMNLVDKNVFSAPFPLHVYKSSNIEDAFRYMQSGTSFGKIVIELNAEDVVQTIPSSLSTYDFNETSTYVVAGGLGGIGRDICRWMASRKARYFILLSRSAKHDDLAKDLIDELRREGVTVMTPICDIADKAILKSVLRQYGQTMPPIKGCIQSTLALHDVPFDSMTLHEFNIAIRPKVQGSWNLHSLLPKDLDFFVLLSSGAGITGSRSQANYACGNVYQDALARHRVKCGQRAHAIDLGVVQSIGYAAERWKIVDYLIGQGYGSITEQEIFAILDYCCDPRRPLPSPRDCQVVTGIESLAVLNVAGIPEPFWLDRPLWRHVRSAGRSAITQAEYHGLDVVATTANEYRTLLTAASTLDEASEVICTGLVVKLSKSLGLLVEDIDTNKPAYLYGVDSLSAVEVRNWLSKEMGAEVPIFQVMGNGSIRDLALAAAGKSEFTSKMVKEREL